jgi:hypothetical protein
MHGITRFDSPMDVYQVAQEAGLERVDPQARWPRG